MSVTRILAVAFLFPANICGAHEVAPLLSLANEWGKGTILEFHEKVYKVMPSVVNNGGSDVVLKWYLDLVSYPDLLEETGETYWMREKVELMLQFALCPPVNASTNCWLSAAKLLNRYSGMARQADSNAWKKVDLSLIKKNPELFNKIFYGRRSLKIKAWNLKCIEDSLARVVTNEFPKSILPLLPESDRAKMMEDVFVRAGLQGRKDEKAQVPCSRILTSAVLLGSLASFVVLGRVMWKYRRILSACDRGRRRFRA